MRSSQVVWIESFAAGGSASVGIEAGKRIAARNHRGAQSGFVSDNSGLSTGPKPCSYQGQGRQPARDQDLLVSTSETARGRHDTQSPPRRNFNKQLRLDSGWFRTGGAVERFPFGVAFLLHAFVADNVRPCPARQTCDDSVLQYL